MSTESAIAGTCSCSLVASTALARAFRLELAEEASCSETLEIRGARHDGFFHAQPIAGDAGVHVHGRRTLGCPGPVAVGARGPKMVAPPFEDSEKSSPNFWVPMSRLRAQLSRDRPVVLDQRSLCFLANPPRTVSELGDPCRNFRGSSRVAILHVRRELARLETRQQCDTAGADDVLTPAARTSDPVFHPAHDGCSSRVSSDSNSMGWSAPGE